jgi:hypothetical protein
MPTAQELAGRLSSFVATHLGSDVLEHISGVAPSTMWARDGAYAAQARPVDGTRCAATGNPDLTTCNQAGEGGTMCNWRFIQVDRACDAQAYLQVMFQADRYLWCQTQLAHLLAATPGGQQGLTVDNNQPRYASAWVDWCRQVMQLVTMSRWATNIHPGYLPDVNDMPAAQAVLQQVLADHASIDLRGVAAPSRVNADDFYPLKDQLLVNLFKPSVMAVDYKAAFVFPRVAADFEPCTAVNMSLLEPAVGPFVLDDTARGLPALGPGSNRAIAVPVSRKSTLACSPEKAATAVAYPGTTTCNTDTVWGDFDPLPPARGMGDSRDVAAQMATMGQAVTTGAPWPASWVVVSAADSSISRRMQLWYQTTLGASDFVPQRGNFYARARMTRSGSGVAVRSSMATVSTKFWWASAALQIKLCIAWAQDVVNTSFETMVANGFQAYLDAIAIIPEQYHNLASASLAALRNALSEKAFQDASEVIAPIFGLAAGIAAAIPVVGTVVGAIIAAVGALVEALAKLISGALAAGTFGWEAACIPPPVMRMIKSSTDAACDFDPSDGNTQAVVARATAIQAAASAGLPVSVWHDVAATATPAAPGSLPSFGPGLTPGPPIQPPANYTGWVVLGALGLGLGGLLLYKATR